MLGTMSNEIQFLLYSLPDEEGKVQVVIKDETIWCTQKAMALLFGVQRPAITKHLGNIFKDGELDEKVVCSILEHTTEHGAIEGKTQTSPTKDAFLLHKPRKRLNVNTIFLTRPKASTLTSISKSEGCWGIKSKRYGIEEI